MIDRVKELKSSKQWTSTKTPAPSTEPERQKAHWDFLLEEVVWMHKDFKNERHVRKLYQRKICHAVTKYHNHLKNSEEDSDRMIKEREKEARKACAFISKMIKEFWQKAEMIVDHGQKVILMFILLFRHQKEAILTLSIFYYFTYSFSV